MGEIIKDTAAGLPWYQYMILGICAALLIGGFFLPPLGVIDNSVLKGAGELLLGGWGFGFLVRLPEYIKAGASIRVSHNGTEIEAKGNKSE